MRKPVIPTTVAVEPLLAMGCAILIVAAWALVLSGCSSAAEAVGPDTEVRFYSVEQSGKSGVELQVWCNPGDPVVSGGFLSSTHMRYGALDTEKKPPNRQGYTCLDLPGDERATLICIARCIHREE